MDARLEQQHVDFRNAVRSMIRRKRQLLSADLLQHDRIYQCYESASQFAIEFPTSFDREQFIQSIVALRKGEDAFVDRLANHQDLWTSR